MKHQIIRTQTFRAAYTRLPAEVRRIVEEKIRLLAENPTHPSLQTHRLRRISTQKVWICYISTNKRLLYQYKNDVIYLRDVGKHSIVDRIRQYQFG
jgi:mRNA interferase RelE/StbE